MDRSYVNPVESLTVEAAGLEGVVDRYHSGLLPEATQRSLARAGSLVPGGQGMRRCDCQGKCDTKRCACMLQEWSGMQLTVPQEQYTVQELWWGWHGSR